MDFLLKILYHLGCSGKIWSKVSPSVKAKVREAKAEAIKRLNFPCGGLLIDASITQGGTNNIGPVARQFFIQATEKQNAIRFLIEVAGRILPFFFKPA